MIRSSRPDIASTWQEFHATRSVASRNRLVEHYAHLVQKIANVLARRLWPRVTADELASAGFEGLIAAVSAFDPERGVKFETYCRQRIVGAIRDWQREIDPLGRSGRTFERNYNSIAERIHAERGEYAENEEVADQMGLPMHKFMRMRRTVTASHNVPLESRIENGEDTRIGAVVPVDPGPSPVQHTERELIREHITRGLKETDRLIIVLYYYERMTMAEIGAVLGVSESRVCQRHAEVIDQLRTRFANSECELIPEPAF